MTKKTSSNSTTSKVNPTPPKKTSNSFFLPNIPIITLRDGVIFPQTKAILAFERESSLKAIEASKKNNGLALVISQKDPDQEKITASSQLYQTGTIIKISSPKGSFSKFASDFETETTNLSDPDLNHEPSRSHKVAQYLVEAQERAILLKLTQKSPFLAGDAKPVFGFHKSGDHSKISFLLNQLIIEFQQLIQFGNHNLEMEGFLKAIDGLKDENLIDLVANILHTTTPAKQAILDELDIKKRALLVIKQIKAEFQVAIVEKEVVDKTNIHFDKNMKENILRERLRIIQQELGELDDEEQVADEYEKKLSQLKLKPEIHNKIAKEIRRYKQLTPANPESSYVRNWLDTIFELPLQQNSTDILDIKQAEQLLADSHYGLKEVKDRILEYIAVLQLRKTNKIKSQTKPTILCFVGPPGVGKTSIGQSIAEAMGRRFTKISLGGIKDEAEIRGHRRTYVGALPGRIIEGIKRAGKSNPVFMLDEIDKLGSDYKGDPSSALLEVLDPEQNHSFEDHYLDIPFDLSQVIFIATANTLDIPTALRDRLEIIQYSGYTVQEKLAIAKIYLWKKTLQANNLKTSQIKINDEMLLKIIENYTKEAGVRGLERQLNKLMRKTARQIVSGEFNKIDINNFSQIKHYLGAPIYDVSLAEEKDEVGVVTGLAWTPVGGDVLFIEAATTKKGKGDIKLTGHLGLVMKESVQTALTYVKSHSHELGLKVEEINKTDLHLHVPEGATPKDGPSAGVAMVTAITSVLTGRPVRKGIAMTGEVTLRGKVLRIGGLKEKAIAGHRAGCKTIIIPAENLRDLEEIPDTVKHDIQFKPVHNVSEVLDLALMPRKLNPS